MTETDIISQHRVEAERQAIEACLSHALGVAASMRPDLTAPIVANALTLMAGRCQDHEPATLMAEIAEEVGKAAANLAVGLTCPQCGGPTRPDEDRPGARYCDICEEPVRFLPGPIAAGAAAEINGLVDALDNAFEAAKTPDDLAELCRFVEVASFYAGFRQRAADQLREAARVASWAAEQLEEVNSDL